MTMKVHLINVCVAMLTCTAFSQEPPLSLNRSVERGLLLGSPGVEKSGERTDSTGKDDFSLRVVKDFTKTDAEAEAASFNLTKDEGSTELIDVDLDVVLSSPRVWEAQGDLLSGWLTVEGGASFDRRDSGDEARDLQRYFVALHLKNEANEKMLGFIPVKELYVGPVFEKDDITSSERVTLLFEYEPLAEGSPSGDSERKGFGAGRTWRDYVYIRPRIALEENTLNEDPEITDPSMNESATEIEDQLAELKSKLEDSFLRYGVEIKVTPSKQVELVYELKVRNTLPDFDESYVYHEATLKFAVDVSRSALSFQARWKKGEDAPDFEDVSRYEIGVGLKI